MFQTRVPSLPMSVNSSSSVRLRVVEFGTNAVIEFSEDHSFLCKSLERNVCFFLAILQHAQK